MKNFKMIIGATSSNEIEELKLERKSIYTPPIQLSDIEFDYYCSFYPNTRKLISKRSDADQIISITGGVSFELNCLLNIENAKTLKELIIKYSNGFIDPLNKDRFSVQSIGHWFEKNISYKQDIIENIVRCLYSTSLDAAEKVFDKRFLYLDKTNVLRLFSSFAMVKLLKYYSRHLNDSLIKEFETITNSQTDYNNSVLGNFVQVFIIQSLCTGMLRL